MGWLKTREKGNFSQKRSIEAGGSYLPALLSEAVKKAYVLTSKGSAEHF